MGPVSTPGASPPAGIGLPRRLLALALPDTRWGKRARRRRRRYCARYARWDRVVRVLRATSMGGSRCDFVCPADLPPPSGSAEALSPDRVRLLSAPWAALDAAKVTCGRTRSWRRQATAPFASYWQTKAHSDRCRLVWSRSWTSSPLGGPGYRHVRPHRDRHSPPTLIHPRYSNC